METMNKPMSDLLKEMYLTIDPNVEDASTIEAADEEGLDEEAIDAELEEACSIADSILEANGLEIDADDLEQYVEGLQQVLEAGELDEESSEHLDEIIRQIGKVAGKAVRAGAAAKSTGKGMAKGFLKGYIKARAGSRDTDIDKAADLLYALGGNKKFAAGAKKRLARQAVAKRRAQEEVEDDSEVLDESLKQIFESTEKLLESVGFEVEAETLDEYLEGIQQILENEDLSEEERERLEGFFKKLGKFAGTTARIVTAPIRGVKRVAGAIKSGAQKVSGAVHRAAGELGAGYAAGRHGIKEPAAPKPPQAKKPGVVSAFKAGYQGARDKAKQQQAVAHAQPAAVPPRKDQAASAQAAPQVKQISPQAKKELVRKEVVKAAGELKAKTGKKQVVKKGMRRLPASVKGVRAGMRPNLPSAALAGFTVGQKRAAGESLQIGADSLTGICEDRRRWIEKAMGTPVAPELVLEGK